VSEIEKLSHIHNINYSERYQLKLNLAEEAGAWVAGNG